MGNIAALLLLIGCSDDLSQCRELPAPTIYYDTKQDCDRALPSSLGAFTGQFEQLYAQCIPIDPALQKNARSIWKVYPDGTLIASARARDVIVASISQSTEGDDHFHHQ
jgi:hypothetical protein